MPSRLPKHLEQLRLLAVCHFAYSGFALLGLGLFYWQYRLTRRVVSLHEDALSAFPGDDAGGIDGPIPGLLSAFYLVGGSILVAMLVANVVSGICLYQVKGRTLSLIVAVLNCLQFPVGTVLAAFTIFTLFQEPVREAYDGDAGLGFTKQ